MSGEIKRDFSQMASMFQSTSAETQTTVSAANDLRVTQVSISILNHFPNHPFELYTGEKFDDLVESIKTHGVLTPILVRKLEDDTYQILSGHNRCEAARAAKFRTVPCVVLEGLTDDEALMIVLDSNTKQRGITEMKISEQAHIYALDVAVNKRQGKRSDLLKNIEKNLKILDNHAENETSYQFDTKLRTLDIIGAKYGISGATISRLLRIDTLIDELKVRIDDEEFAINAGVELSYLSAMEQELVNETMIDDNYRLDIKKAKLLRELSGTNKFNDANILMIFEGTYNKPKKSPTPSVKAVTLKPRFLSRYYSSNVSQSLITEEVEASVSLWQKLKKAYPGLTPEALALKVESLIEDGEENT